MITLKISSADTVTVRPLSLPWKAIHLLFITLTGMGITLMCYDRSYDDAFITFRYAANFAHGHGLVYNSGDAFLGTTGPLFALFLGSLAAISTAPIAGIGGIASGVGLTLTAIGIYLHLSEIEALSEWAPTAGFIAATTLVTARIHLLVMGGEILVSTSFVVWAFLFHQRGKWRTAIGLLALATLCRPDSLLAMVPLIIGLFIHDKKTAGRAVLLYLLCLMPFVIAATVFYGTPLPSTLAAKIAQRDAGWPSFGASAPLWLWTQGPLREGDTSYMPYSIVGTALAAAGILFALQAKAKSLYPLLLWSFLHAFVYICLQIPFYHWYIVPLSIGWYACVGIGFAGLAQQFIRSFRAAFLKSAPTKTLLLTAPLLLAIFYAPAQIGDSEGIYTDKSRRVLYTQILDWIDKDGGKNASIGFYEIGYIGYYGQSHPIVDPLGLVTKDVASHVAQRDFYFAYKRNRPQYIVARNVQRPHNEAAPLDYAWFRTEYRLVLHADMTSTHLVVFRRDKPSEGLPHSSTRNH